MRKFLIRFLSETRASVTIEFVLVFPLLVLWLVVSFVMFDAFKSNSIKQKVTYTVSDIASRYGQISDAEIGDLVDVARRMLPPRLDRRIVRISSVCFEDDTYKVLWSHSWSDPEVPGLPLLTDDTIPLDIMPSLQRQRSVILTEIHARWRPLSSIGGLSDQQWSNAHVTGPRFVTIIPHEDINPATVCPRDVPMDEGPSVASADGLEDVVIGAVEAVFSNADDD